MSPGGGPRARRPASIGRRLLLTVSIAAAAPLLIGAHCTESCPPPRTRPVYARTLSLTLEGPAALTAPSPLSLVSLLALFPERALRVEVSRPVVVSLERSTTGAPPRELATVERSATIPLFVDRPSLDDAMRGDYTVIVIRPREADAARWTLTTHLEIEAVQAWRNDPVHGQCVDAPVPVPSTELDLVPIGSLTPGGDAGAG